MLTYAVNVTLAHSSVCSIRENADTIKESTNSGAEMYTVQICFIYSMYSTYRMNCTTNYGRVSYISITLEINQYIVQKCMYTVQICLIYSRYSTYRVSQEEWTKLRESVPYVKIYRYNPKHLCPKLNGYGDNGQRSLKL